MMAVSERRAQTRPLPSFPQQAPFTRPLSFLLVGSAVLTVAIYLHSVNVEGTSNRNQQEIKQNQNTNLHLQLELAHVQAPQKLESQAKALGMGPAQDVIYLPAVTPPSEAGHAAQPQEALAPLVGY